MNCVIVASTSGGVISNLLKIKFFFDRISCVVSDRECGAIEIADKFGIPTKVYKTSDNLEFSNYLLQEYRENLPDIFISFYTRLFVGDFLIHANKKIINLHPSILPACPGMDGFGDTLKSGSRFFGATIHFVKAGMDNGPPIIQSASPLNPNLKSEIIRHQVYIQQCKMLLQVIKWYEDCRVKFDIFDRPTIANSSYLIGEYSPNLDFIEAIQFNVELML